MLGGDAHHTVLVKGEFVATFLYHRIPPGLSTPLHSSSLPPYYLPGLDFALLEQRKAKLAQSPAAADDDLESAFLEASISVPRKKTREELVKELKQARSSAFAPPARDGLERAKMAGKFKPIGAPDKPVEKEKTKKKKRAKDGADNGERKKKKRKIESEPAVTTEVQRNGDEDAKTLEQKVSGVTPSGDTEATLPAPTKQKAPTPSPIDDDDDIFADAEEYKGLEVSDDDDDEEEGPKTPSKPSGRHSPSAGSLSNDPIRNWFGEPVEPDNPPSSSEPPVLTPALVAPSSASSIKPHPRREEHEGDLIEGATLRGLASSTVPSIKDLLAMDEAAEREEKRKAKKEKNKAKKKLSEDTKLDREVKK
jgi:IK cytokine